MSTKITVKRGLDINLQGSAERVMSKSAQASAYALCPDNYVGVTPKLLVKVDDQVTVGTPLFFDKQRPEILFTSPVTGRVSDIVRGDKRKLLSIVVTPEGDSHTAQIDHTPLAQMNRDEARELLLKTGLWATLIRRPFGTIACTDETPRDIYISACDTAPLGVDFEVILQDQIQTFNAGIEMLAKLTSGKVYVGIRAENSTLSKIKGAELLTISGKHPAGLVGTQIAATKPIAKGEVVWTVNPAHVVMIGRLAANNTLSFEQVIAVGGASFKKTGYTKIIVGAKLDTVTNVYTPFFDSRLIAGNPLCGVTVTSDSYLPLYANAICAIPEGDHHEFVGWAMPRFGKFSASHSYFSFLMPKKKYNLDTNINGGERAFVMNGLYEQVTPLDIYPVYLLKAVMAGDIDKMEQLGIYEVVEEDLALCEFVCPSKIEWQKTLRDGINLMIKEL